MSHELQRIASFENEFEAENAKAILADAGIDAFLEGGFTNTTLSFAATGWKGVKLFVRSEDVDTATTMLHSPKDDGDDGDGEPWSCGNCQEEVDAGFAVCWSCGRPRSEVEGDFELPLPVSTSSPESNAVERLATTSGRAIPPEDLNNPFLAPQTFVERPVEAKRPPNLELEAAITRAWRAAWIGCFLVPMILNFYSLYMLFRTSTSEYEISAKSNRRWYVALIVNLTAIFIWLSVFALR